MKDYTAEAKRVVEKLEVDTGYLMYEELSLPLLVEISEKLSTLISLIDEKKKAPLF